MSAEVVNKPNDKPSNRPASYFPDNRVRYVCGEKWFDGPQEEREGGYAVAIMSAYLDGCRPTIEDIADYLGLDEQEVSEIEVPYRRMLVSGLFSPKFNARRDKALQSKDDTAWCYIAGIGSGFVGAGHYITQSKLREWKEQKEAALQRQQER